ncbi:hypothetical protein QFZ75_004442 [Streptomyces sp. V3I8]|nr:hypothetical protein [Streptomyces sp. V3I8]MDQ1038026.1 hypothetical protein [Streptomyces sp. V3I8]
MPVKGARHTPLNISAAALTLSLSALLLTTPAHTAEPKPSDNGAGSNQQGGGSDDTGIYAAAQVQYSGAVAKNGGIGNVSSADVNWTPPACWYAPYLGAKDFKKKMSSDIEKWQNDPAITGTADSAIGEVQRHYKDDYGWADTPGYKDYNVDKDGEGMFWAGVENPNEPNYAARTSCSDLPFWVENGETPPPQYEEAITPEMLAALAYQHMELPGTKVTLAPQAITKVNLPTWAWLDKAVFDEVQATAAINAPGFNITATTTAKPKSLTLSPGTADATTIPADGGCPIVNGKIGEPYAKGKAKQTPPCGIVYRRSSGGETFPLKAALTWEISWTGTGQAGAVGLPDGTIEAVQNITVEEIQSVNR